MAASPQFLTPERSRSKRFVANAAAQRLRAPHPPQRQGRPSRPTVTPVVPAQRQSRATRQAQEPLLLRLILFLQHSSSAIAFALVGAVLLAYASTVYIQQQWSEEYRKLESLQREMRNLTAADAIFKENLAQQAEQPETGLVMPTPDNNIYLAPSQVQPTAKPAPKTAPAASSASNLPIGY
jgi:hypothetical protein